MSYTGDIVPLEKYGKSMMQSATDRGIKVDIDNVACDENFLVLFYTVSGEGQDDKGNALDVLNGQLTSTPKSARNGFEFAKADRHIKSLI